MGNHKVEFHREAQTMKPILTGRERRKTQEITGKMSEERCRVIQVQQPGGQSRSRSRSRSRRGR